MRGDVVMAAPTPDPKDKDKTIMTPSGDSPVPGNRLVRVTFRNGDIEELPSWGIDWWGDHGHPEDVVKWEYADKEESK